MALELSASEARLEARVLLQAVLDTDRAWLLAHGNDVLDTAAHKRFETLLIRRLRGEPVAYIIGRREFYGLEFSVTPATLIPRDQLWFHHPEMQARVARAEADRREGRVVSTETPDEAQALLDSLKSPSRSRARRGA